jgi:ribosome biogenesis GTPase
VREEDGLEVPRIEAVLDRAGAITRGDPGETSDAQVLAANVDTVLVVHPIASPPNLRRIERELTLAWDSGAVPAVVLTKADLCPSPEQAASAVSPVAPGVDVHLTSAATGRGVTALLGYAGGHRTVALIGPSGAGKSTLINALLREDRQATREVRVSDGKGRHTTVTRELVPLPGGGVLVDTPGLRALALTGSSEGIGAAFPDVERLAEGCRFRDCTHSHEPGCAVRAAVGSGALDADRLASYHKLQRETLAAAMKTDARLRATEVRKWKIIHKSMRVHYRDKGRG